MEDEQIVQAETPVEIVEQAMEAPDEGASSVSEPVEDTRPEWVKVIESVPAEELRKHDRISGIVGSEKQAWERSWEDSQRAKIRAEEAARIDKEREEAEAELDRLYEQNPLEFADKVQNDRQIQRAQQRVQRLQIEARKAVASQVGAAYHDVPEWQQVINDPSLFATLTQAIQGKGEDEVIPAWNRAAADAIATVRGRNLAEATLAERIKQEKTAWETEMAANGFIASDRPQLLKGRGVANLDPEPNWRSQPKEWEAWYERNNRRAG